MMIEPEDIVFDLSNTYRGYHVLTLRVENQERNIKMFSNISEENVHNTSIMNHIKTNMINHLNANFPKNIKKTSYLKKTLFKVARIDFLKDGF